MPPFVQPVEQTIHTENEILDGYIVELLRHLSNTVPFTFDLQKVKDGDGMGRRHRDGSYSGILGELIRKVSAIQMVTQKLRKPGLPGRCGSRGGPRGPGPPPDPRF